MRSYVAAMLVMLGGALGVAQVAQKVTTVEELDKAMKRVQPAMMGANKALKAQNFSEAGTQLAIVRQVMEDSREFWVLHKKEDALKANAETIVKIDETQKLIKVSNAEGATASLKELGATCRTCHETYRARDADNNWVLKPGSID